MNNIRQLIKPWILPFAMIIGVLFHDYIGKVAFLSPYLIFVMLLITYCRISPDRFKIPRYIWMLLAVQIAGSLAVFMAIKPFGLDLAQGRSFGRSRSNRNARRLNNSHCGLFAHKQHSGGIACPDTILIHISGDRHPFYRLRTCHKRQSIAIDIGTAGHSYSA